MELRVNDYVRIKWGNGLQTISKCKNIVDMGDTQYAKDDFYIHTDHSGEVIYKTMIVKSSPNIIDLIEEDDFINGMRITQIISNKNGVLECMKDSDYEFITTITNNEVESVLTHEQFESMKYRIGE